MDNKDQRNASVPLGTFNEEAGADASENTDLFVELADQDAPAEPTTSADFARARPGRKRVRTLLGVPLADVRETNAASSQRSESISEAIQHMLDEQASIAIQVDEQESETDGAMLSDDDLDELAELPPSGVLSVAREAEESVNDDAPTKTRIPLLVPSQYVEAQALDRAQPDAGQAAAESEPAAVREVHEVHDVERVDHVDDNARTIPVIDSNEPAIEAAPRSLTAADGGSAPVTQTLTAADGGEALAATAASATPTPAPTPTVTAAAAGRATSAGRVTRGASGRPPKQPIVSSLAPREVARQPAARDAGPGIGLLMVAAMALIAAGGWWLTAGSFSRSRDGQANQRGASTQAAASQPLAAPSETAMALETQPQAPQPSEAQRSQSDSAEADQASAAPNPVKSTSLTATSRALRRRTPKAPKLVPNKDGGIPLAPSRADVLNRMEAVRPAVRACATGLSGVADLDITIAKSGVVTHVLVGGDFAGTTQGSCIARAVREAKFPSFKQDRFRLLFPYPI